MARSSPVLDMALPAARIAVEPITPVLGAEIHDLDLSVPIGGDLAAELNAALHRYGVLVFRGQATMSRADQVALARVFGPVLRSRLADAEEPDIVRIVHDKDRPATENIWHVDHSFERIPPLGAVLRAIEIPPAGGDTLFADMRAVWRRLPPQVRGLLVDLEAVHDVAKCAPASRAEELHAAAPPTRHPVMRIHPDTGDEILFVNAAYTTCFPGVEPAEGRALLDFLLQQVAVPEVQCRLRWQAGTVAVWDNRSMQHYAVGDYYPSRRVMDRVSIGET